MHASNCVSWMSLDFAASRKGDIALLDSLGLNYYYHLCNELISIKYDAFTMIVTRKLTSAVFRSAVCSTRAVSLIRRFVVQ